MAYSLSKYINNKGLSTINWKQIAHNVNNYLQEAQHVKWNEVWIDIKDINNSRLLDYIIARHAELATEDKKHIKKLIEHHQNDLVYYKDNQPTTSNKLEVFKFSPQISFYFVKRAQWGLDQLLVPNVENDGVILLPCWKGYTHYLLCTPGAPDWEVIALLQRGIYLYLCDNSVYALVIDDVGKILPATPLNLTKLAKNSCLNSIQWPQGKIKQLYVKAELDSALISLIASHLKQIDDMNNYLKNSLCSTKGYALYMRELFAQLALEVKEVKEEKTRKLLENEFCLHNTTMSLKQPLLDVNSFNFILQKSLTISERYKPTYDKVSCYQVDKFWYQRAEYLNMLPGSKIPSHSILAIKLYTDDTQLSNTLKKQVDAIDRTKNTFETKLTKHIIKDFSCYIWYDILRTTVAIYGERRHSINIVSELYVGLERRFFFNSMDIRKIVRGPFSTTMSSAVSDRFMGSEDGCTLQLNLPPKKNQLNPIVGLDVNLYSEFKGEDEILLFNIAPINYKSDNKFSSLPQYCCCYITKNAQLSTTQIKSIIYREKIFFQILKDELIVLHAVNKETGHYNQGQLINSDEQFMQTKNGIVLLTQAQLDNFTDYIIALSQWEHDILSKRLDVQYKLRYIAKLFGSTLSPQDDYHYTFHMRTIYSKRCYWFRDISNFIVKIENIFSLKLIVSAQQDLDVFREIFNSTNSNNRKVIPFNMPAITSSSKILYSLLGYCKDPDLDKSHVNKIKAYYLQQLNIILTEVVKKRVLRCDMDSIIDYFKNLKSNIYSLDRNVASRLFCNNGKFSKFQFFYICDDDVLLNRYYFMKPSMGSVIKNIKSQDSYVRHNFLLHGDQLSTNQRPCLDVAPICAKV